ncbi:MAG: phospho-sugar mutase [Peptostreptococcaceae bacterium]|nr:phospho-sugar mutase [Peptostreptococcaceae bacterium]
MDHKARYELWLASSVIDEKTKQELRELEGDEAEIRERFYKELEFGTAGLRGKLGAGADRMNQYVIARATDAFAKVILSEGDAFSKRGVVIAHDPRLFSKEFALTAALVFASNGIKAYLFEDLRPTPELSFAVRHLNCAAGLNITASHNPKDYNGYKVYWEEGSQIKDDIADRILEQIARLDRFEKVEYLCRKNIYTKEWALKNGLLEYIGKSVDDAYNEAVKALSLNDEELDKSLRIVYTPLNGAGNVPVRRVLKERGFEQVYVVKEQEMPDGTFPTIEYPNPEDTRAFEYALRLAKEVDGELVIATDPDCDRIAIIVKHGGEYVEINGNQAGYILVHYILSQMDAKDMIEKDALIVKSIVTSELGAKIAKKYGVPTRSVLTGFKNICGVQNELDRTGGGKMIMGWEESIGYAVGTFVRDKDGVSASMLFAEIAAYYKKRDMTLIDLLEELFQEFGYHLDDTVSIVLEGLQGQERIGRMMSQYREMYPEEIGSMRSQKYLDYKTSEELDIISGEKTVIDVEKQNAIKFIMDDTSWYALRPSGTEPKIKIYMNTVGKTREEAQEKLALMKEKVIGLLHGIE